MVGLGIKLVISNSLCIAEVGQAWLNIALYIQVISLSVLRYHRVVGNPFVRVRIK